MISSPMVLITRPPYCVQIMLNASSTDAISRRASTSPFVSNRRVLPLTSANRMVWGRDWLMGSV